MKLVEKIMTMDSPDIAHLDRINFEAFPDDERIELPEMFRICDAANGEVLGWYAEEKLIGYTMNIKNKKSIYLDFFATDCAERSKGYGKKILKQLQDKYSDRQLMLDFETMDPEAENYEIRKRRKNFYLRCGMKETGYYTKLFDNYFELVCNREKLDVESAQNLMQQIHAVMSETSEKLYKKIE